MLPDRLGAASLRRSYPGAALDFLRNAYARAEKFVFDPQASGDLGAFAHAFDERAFLACLAEPAPFPTCYVEIYPHPFLTALQGRPPAAETTASLGLLIDGNAVFTFMHSGRGELPVVILPFVLTLDGSLPPAAIAGRGVPAIAAAGADADMAAAIGGLGLSPERFMAACLFGSHERHAAAPPAEDVLAGARLTMFGQLARGLQGRAAVHMLTETFGDFRTLKAAFCAINTTGASERTPVAASSRLVAGRRIAAPRHALVRLKPGAVRVYADVLARRRAEDDRRAAPVEHAVRASWAHYRLDPSCRHDFPAHPTIGARHICPHCGGFRVRRKAHRRGDATKGVLDRPYVVLGKTD